MILRILRRTASNLAVLAGLSVAWIGAGFLPEPAMIALRIPLWGLAFLGFLVLVSRIALEESPAVPDDATPIFRPAAAAAKPFAPPDPSELARVQVLLRSAGVEPYMVGRAVRVTLDLSIARGVSLEEAVAMVMAALRGDAATLSRSNIVLPAGAQGEDALEVLRRRFARELRSRAGAPWHDEAPLSSEPAWVPASRMVRPDDGSVSSSQTDGHLDWSDDEPIATSPPARAPSTPTPQTSPPDWGEAPEEAPLARVIAHQADPAWDNIFSPEELTPSVEAAFGQVDPHTGRPPGAPTAPASPPRASFPGVDDLWSLIDPHSEIERLVGIHLGHSDESEAGTVVAEPPPVVLPAPVALPVPTPTAPPAPVALPVPTLTAPPAPGPLIAPVAVSIVPPILAPAPRQLLTAPDRDVLRTEKKPLRSERTAPPVRFADPFAVLPPIPAGPFAPAVLEGAGLTIRPEDFLDWPEEATWWPAPGERSEPTLEPEADLSAQSIDPVSLEDLLAFLDS